MAELSTLQDDETAIAAVASIINDRYRTTEGDIWNLEAGFCRTSEEELKGIIADDDQVVIVVAENESIIIGAIRVALKGNGVAEFGMLAVRHDSLRRGIGKMLVLEAEKWAALRGCEKMVLEILKPRNRHHAFKEFLTSWYIQMGYEKDKTMKFEDLFPELVKTFQLSCPCNALIMSKKLSGS